MPQAVVDATDKLGHIATTARGYYDSDDLYNYHRHVRNR